MGSVPGDAADQPRRKCLVMEYCLQGLDKFTAQGSRALEEQEAAFLIRQLVEGLEFLHSRRIVHR